MKISEKSWHFRIVNLCNEEPNDLCSYFWTLVRNLLVGAGILAIIVVLFFMIGLIGFNYATKNYIVTEKGWKNGHATTTWHFMTKEEKILSEQKTRAIEAENIRTYYGSEKEYAEVKAQNKKKSYWDLTKAIAILIGIFIFIGIGWVKGDDLDYSLAQKISAFTIIPAVAITLIIGYCSGSYSELSTALWSDYRPRDYGLSFIIIMSHTILIAILWAIFTSAANIAAAITTNLTEEKDLSGVDVICRFIKAKKEKVCPLIEYVNINVS